MKIENEMDSNMESIAETCSALLKRIEALEKLTEEQTRTIISFTDHTNALMSRIETVEKEIKLYKYKSLIDQMREDGEIDF